MKSSRGQFYTWIDLNHHWEKREPFGHIGSFFFSVCIHCLELLHSKKCHASKQNRDFILSRQINNSTCTSMHFWVKLTRGFRLSANQDLHCMLSHLIKLIDYESVVMDRFFNLSTNSILTNVQAKLAKNGGQNSKYSHFSKSVSNLSHILKTTWNILNFAHHFLPIWPARLSI